MDKQIAIYGDSWSYQSWNKSTNMVEAPGTKKFQSMFQTNQVTNFSVQGNTNYKILEQIEQTDLSKKEIIIVFQTDPLRDMFVNNNLDIIDLEYASSWNDLIGQFLCRFYSQLENIQKKLNKHVLLVGGLSKLNQNIIPNNLDYIDKSWTELCVDGYQDCYFEWLDPTLKIYNYARKKFKWDCSLADFFEIEKQILNKNSIWQNNHNFSWCHASDSGYVVMFNALQNKLKEIFDDNRG